MANTPNQPSKDGHLDLAVGLLLDQIAIMLVVGLLRLQTAQNVVYEYMFDQRLSPMTRRQAARLHGNIKLGRKKRTTTKGD